MHEGPDEGRGPDGDNADAAATWEGGSNEACLRSMQKPSFSSAASRQLPPALLSCSSKFKLANLMQVKCGDRTQWGVRCPSLLMQGGIGLRSNSKPSGKTCGTTGTRTDDTKGSNHVVAIPSHNLSSVHLPTSLCRATVCLAGSSCHHAQPDPARVRTRLRPGTGISPA